MPEIIQIYVYQVLELLAYFDLNGRPLSVETIESHTLTRFFNFLV